MIRAPVEDKLDPVRPDRCNGGREGDCKSEPKLEAEVASRTPDGSSSITGTESNLKGHRRCSFTVARRACGPA